MTEKLFETATRKQYRFLSKNGHLSVEDLWELNLKGLDEIYSKIALEIQQIENKSNSLFNTSNSAASKELQAKRDIVKYIFETRQEEENQRKLNAIERQKRAEKRQALEAILKKKEFESFDKLSEEDILKQLKELQD